MSGALEEFVTSQFDDDGTRRERTAPRRSRQDDGSNQQAGGARNGAAQLVALRIRIEDKRLDRTLKTPETAWTNRGVSALYVWVGVKRDARRRAKGDDDDLRE